ncbi:hypothetical protein [Haloactinomyces albus]|uniref:Uncharacterized protein n=1 Tax=Haloactinomyces albus TaxID=1352928 RepID=A0AAE3ZCN4_9ACTN|nr:hypothetical protein [Haloactinomyces albus]MDR7301425.1 hypothetical protein [Haloactinomyces albus]
MLTAVICGEVAGGMILGIAHDRVRELTEPTVVLADGTELP